MFNIFHEYSSSFFSPPKVTPKISTPPRPISPQPLEIETFIICPSREQQHEFIRNNPEIKRASVVSVPITSSFKILKLFENSTDEAKLPQFMSRILGYIVIFTEMIKTNRERCIVYDCLAKVREQHIGSEGYDITFFEKMGMSFLITKAGATRMIERFSTRGVRYVMIREFKEELKCEENDYVDMPHIITLSCELDFRIDTRFYNELLFWFNQTGSKGVRYIDEDSKTNFPFDPQSKVIYIDCPLGKSIRIGRKDMLTNIIVCNNIAILNVTIARPILWYSISDKFFITCPEPMISDQVEKDKCFNGLFLNHKKLF